MSNELPTELEPDEPVIAPNIDSVLPSIALEDGYLHMMMVSGLSNQEENGFPESLELLKASNGALTSMTYAQTNYKQAATGVSSVLKSNPEIHAQWKQNLMNAFSNCETLSAAAEDFIEGFINEFK